MEYGRDYYTLHFCTEWTDCDNIVISLYENGNPYQIGIVEVRVFKTGDHKGEAFIWNLYVCDTHRGKGYGRVLLSDAYDVAMLADCKKEILEWDLRDSPHWVYDWYVREGFEEKEFGKGYALMVKEIKENVE
mgnify:CR=1 FL=1